MKLPDNALPDPSPEDSFLKGDSEMARLIRSSDWSDTPLGPIERWPQSLRTTVSLCLASNFPINIVWGPEHTQIYNDGYRIVCGDKHPSALGMDYTECWASAWSAIGKPFDEALRGDTSFLENQRMFLFRNGYLEETFFTFSLSPIRDETGGIGGLFHPVTETTTTMVGERRTRAIRDLTVRLAAANTTDEIFRFTIETLEGFDFDVPFALLYRLDTDENVYRLDSQCGVAPSTAISPAVLAGDAPWPFDAMLDATEPILSTGLRAALGTHPCGPYDEAPDLGFALPVRQHGEARPDVLMLVGASPRLPLDDAYRSFYVLLSAALRAALTRVAAAEAERQRAETLAALDRAKTTFFSNVSHEFRTPLTLMLGPLEALLDAPDIPSARQDLLGIAHRNAQRLLKLVNSLLDFSRMEAGRMSATFVPTDLSAVTTELASHFESACQAAGLVLRIDCRPLRQPVQADRDMWEKVVLNLLSNAFKFTLQGEITVTLREDAGRALLAVADTGVGIPAREVPHIFDRFHRVEGQRGRSVEGTGIGLSLIRELVHFHGGEITVESTEGQGSRFEVRLPFDQPGTASAAPDTADAPASLAPARQAYVEEAERWLPLVRDPAGTGHSSGQPHVVLAEDNADMRAYIERILAEGGYAVTAAANGADALALIRSGPVPDLVLSDVMMPDMDGFALLQALRADPATCDLMVIMLSARAGEEARVEGLAAGADDYMIKPFSARELQARVDGAIRLARQRRGSSAREHELMIEVAAARGRAAMRESEAQVLALFEQTAAGIAECDLAGNLVRINRRYCQMLGRSSEELLGRNIRELIHPDDVGHNEALLETMARTGEPFDVENRFLLANGAELWVHKTVSPIRIGDDPALQRILAVVIDITDRNRAENELREVSRRKDEFLAMLAHELRNPLAPIGAAAELMNIVQLDPVQLKQTSQVISRQVRHMTGLVDDLLDVSRVTRGLVDIEHTPQDITQVVTHATEQVRPLTESRHHRLVIDLAPDRGIVVGDHKRLVQIVTNLLNNAAKYTPPGGTIQLRTELHPDKVILAVQDNGIGIAASLQTRIFDLFAQAERTPDRTQGGLGLGLALVKSLTELHGGDVSCFSAGVGQGSCFTVTLPRLNQAPAEIEQHEGMAMVPGTGALRILVVDDNVDAAHMLCLLLEAAGHAVTVENDSRRALACARKDRPDVAILDIGLPDISGNELAGMLRASPETKDCLIIAVTGYGQEHDRQRALAAGFDHHMVKPVNAAALIELLPHAPRR